MEVTMREDTQKTNKFKILLGLDKRDPIDKIVKLLSKNFTIKVVNDAEEAYVQIHTFDPDLTILDYSIPKLNPIDLHDGISFVHSHMYLVLCVTSENLEVARRVWNKRAMDYIFKPIQTEHFIQDVYKIVRYIIDRKELDLLRSQIKVLEEKLKNVKIQNILKHGKRKA